MRMISFVFVLATTLFVGCATSEPSHPPITAAHSSVDNASALLEDWMAELAEGEPTSESSLALFAWMLRYQSLRDGGYGADVSHDLARDKTDDLVFAMKKEGYDAELINLTVSLARVMMSDGWVKSGD